MKRTTMGAVASLMVVMALAPLALEAQAGSPAVDRTVRPDRGGRAAFGPRGGGEARVEMAMRLREDLGLTDIQVEQLDALRVRSLANRTERRERIADLRSRIAAGELDAGAARAERDAWAAEDAAYRVGLTAALQGILSEEQLGVLAERREGFRGRPGLRRPGRRGAPPPPI